MRTLIRSTGNRSFAGKAERVRMLKTTDITALTTKEINTLECGDTVIKLTGKQKHRYVVSSMAARTALGSSSTRSTANCTNHHCAPVSWPV